MARSIQRERPGSWRDIDKDRCCANPGTGQRRRNKGHGGNNYVVSRLDATGDQRSVERRCPAIDHDRVERIGIGRGPGILYYAFELLHSFSQGVCS